MKKAIIQTVFMLQIILLNIFYWIFFAISRRSVIRKEWVVGLDEVAANVHNISRALDETISVCMSRHPFYSFNYDHAFPARIGWKYLRYLVRITYSPILFAYLCHKTKGFFYVAGSGFLLTEPDGRDYEFSFLKKRGIRVVCFFCGSEIRSLRLMKKLSEDMDRDVISTYQTFVVKNFDGDHVESFRMKLAASADKYADHIFNAPVDQISYIRRMVHPFMYFYPESGFERRSDKFSDLSRIRIVHGPSSPLIKGTPLVRAAVKKLKQEGYQFEYQELIGVSNSDMLKALREAHVVLNEFYAFVPGQFGVEAMASHCALLTSADPDIETTLPAGASTAWMKTEYWNIYDNLKLILDTPTLISQYADAGFAWAYEYCSYQKNALRLRKILDMPIN